MGPFTSHLLFVTELVVDFRSHPIVGAILIHFWLASDHPFVDGNGRTARASMASLGRRSGWLLAQILVQWCDLVRFYQAARVAKLADAPDLGSGGAILRGSSPLPGTLRRTPPQSY